MKRFVEALLLFLLISPTCLFADGDETDIVIEEAGSSGGGTIFHAPTYVPIGCLFQNSFSTIVVVFLANLGSVSIQIENSTTGETDVTTVNAIAGPMLLPISGSDGLWRITFILSNGVVYSGSFII